MSVEAHSNPHRSARSSSFSDARRAVLANLLAKEGIDPGPPLGIPRRANPKEWPLSFGQRQLWLLDRIESGIHYNEQFHLRFRGRLAVSALEQALGEIVRRHEAMRAVFSEVEGVPIQTILPAQPVCLPTFDLRSIPASIRTAEAVRRAVTETRAPFDLARGPLWRFALVSLADDEHWLLSSAHHIAIDGWSRGVFLRELGALYRAYATGAPSPLPELSVQYADYAEWQTRWLQNETVAGQIEYWQHQLAGGPALLDLPADRPRPALASFRGARLAITLSSEATAALRNLCQREGVTLFVALLAALRTLLHRYTGEEDLRIGTPVADRSRRESEAMIGYFLNTLVLRTKLSADPTFRELLQRERETVLNALAHQDLPLERIIDSFPSRQGPSHTPLFQVLFVLQNTPVPRVELPGLVVAPFDIDSQTAKFDLTLSLAETAGSIRGWIEYATDLFEADRIERLAGHLARIVAVATAHPETRLSQLSYLTRPERSELLERWTRTTSPYPQDTCVHDLFAAQAKRTPERIALEFHGERWTYAKLDSESDAVAARLRARGIGPEDLIGVCLDRSPPLVAAVLGILKAGAAYVPLDPDYPDERLAYVLQDARAKAIVTEIRLLPTVCRFTAVGNGYPTPPILCLDEESQVPVRSGLVNSTSRAARPENLAYVIYTSGSSGKAKGVQIEHRSVVNFLESVRRRPGLNAEDILVAVTTLAFDIAALELFLPLTVGARAVLTTREIAADGLELTRLLERSGATVMQATPVTWRLLLAAGWKGHPRFKILCGGEAWDQDLAKRLLPCCGSLWNMYGPTETTIWSAAGRVTQGQSVRISGPLANTRLYVLDPALQPVPAGVSGELCIGGDGVARGYWNQPALTAAKFLADPFADKARARLYRTGDLARYRPDGTIEFLGRLDQQIKLRGFRIEVGEIEAVIARHPAVREVAVVAGEDPQGERCLVAYLAAEDPPANLAEQVRARLRAAVPEYMVPGRFITLRSLPRTHNGKLDRKALLARQDGWAVPERAAVPPRTPAEKLVLSIFRRFLERADFGVCDSFFDLGGNSISAARMMAHLRTASERDLPLRLLFERQTASALAEAIEALGWTPKSNPQPNPADHRVELVL